MRQTHDQEGVVKYVVKHESARIRSEPQWLEVVGVVKVASCLPAWRAAHSDPMVVLRRS